MIGGGVLFGRQCGNDVMTKVITTQVGSNGVLTLTVPLDQGDANKSVRVTVETLEDASTVTEREDWLRFILETGGSISDPTYKRHPQGNNEERDALP